MQIESKSKIIIFSHCHLQLCFIIYFLDANPISGTIKTILPRDTFHLSRKRNFKMVLKKLPIQFTIP